MSGNKLSGKERIIHGALGAASLLLDFTGVGEIGKAGVLAGRSVGLLEKVGAKLGTKGAAKSARVIEKTVKFMVNHPELTKRAEKYADKKIHKTKNTVKEYKHRGQSRETPDQKDRKSKS